MKKTLQAASLVTLFALTLSACGGGGGGGDTAAAPPAPAPAPAPAPTPSPTPSPSPSPSPSPAPTPGSPPASPPISSADAARLAAYTGTWRLCRIVSDSVTIGGTGTRTLGSESQTEDFSAARPLGTLGLVVRVEYYNSEDCSGTPVARIEPPTYDVTYDGRKITNAGNIADKLLVTQPAGALTNASGPNARYSGNDIVITLNGIAITYPRNVQFITSKQIAFNDGANITYGSGDDGSDGYPLNLNAFAVWKKSS